MSDVVLVCPDCDSDRVTVTSEQSFMANTGEYYCETVKPYDEFAKAKCLDCFWEGKRKDLNHQ